MSPFLTRHDESIVTLAERVSSLSSKIADYFRASSLPEPSFDPSSAASAPESLDYEALRTPLNDAAQDLLRLVNGPKSTLRDLFFSHYDLAALQLALERNFFDHVALADEEKRGTAGRSMGTSTAEIARKAGMDEDRTARVLKFLATHRIFQQVDSEEDRFAHTASSALLARDPGWRATGAMQMDEMFKAASELSDLVERSPHQSDTEHSAFHHRFKMPVYHYYDTHPKKGARFALAMSSWSQVDRQLAELQTSFDWEALGEGWVVDVGGGSGHISIGLAKKFPMLSFVVQDVSTHMLAQARDALTPELQNRLRFQQHDFFLPQPVHDARAFLLRQCLHNYNDDDCIRILQAIVPALEKCPPGTPLLINDIVLPERDAVTRYEEHALRQIDFTMMVVFGAKQRSVSGFDRILKRADARFEITAAHTNPLGVGLVIVQLNSAGRQQ